MFGYLVRWLCVRGVGIYSFVVAEVDRAGLANLLFAKFSFSSFSNKRRL